ncbi:MAG: hypothetical protein WCG84_04540 [Candidatus Moraniibacteriota bacterium]
MGTLYFLGLLFFILTLFLIGGLAYFLAKKLGQWWVFSLILFLGGSVFWIQSSFSILAIGYWIASIVSLIVLKLMKKW